MSHETDVTDSLARMETHILYIREGMDEQKDIAQAQQEQINELFRWRSYLAGAWAVVSGVVLYVATHIFR